MTELFKKKKSDENKELENLKKELEICRFLIKRNEVHFNMTEDENLIASHIYERESLRHQYSYLIKQLREKENTITESQKIKAGE